MNALMNWMEQHLVPIANRFAQNPICLLYTSPSPRDRG